MAAVAISLHGDSTAHTTEGFLRDNEAMAQYRGDDATFHQFPYDTTGLRGKRLRVLSDIPVNDAGVPQDRPAGITDVIAIDDEPNINLSVRVHPPGNPNCVAFVGFEQLAIYD